MPIPSFLPSFLLPNLGFKIALDVLLGSEICGVVNFVVLLHQWGATHGIGWRKNHRLLIRHPRSYAYWTFHGIDLNIRCVPPMLEPRQQVGVRSRRLHGYTRRLDCLITASIRRWLWQAH